MQSVQTEITLQSVLRLTGGGGKDSYEPSLKLLAEKYNVQRRVCRKCYARLSARAEQCRHTRCGHCKKIRAKKAGKD